MNVCNEVCGFFSIFDYLIQAANTAYLQAQCLSMAQDVMFIAELQYESTVLMQEIEQFSTLCLGRIGFTVYAFPFSQVETL